MQLLTFFEKIFFSQLTDEGIYHLTKSCPKLLSIKLTSCEVIYVHVCAVARLAQSVECLSEERDENAVPYYFCAKYVNSKIKCFFSCLD